MSASNSDPIASRCWAVVPAAGSGTRMGAAVPKQYLHLRGRTVLEHTLARLGMHPRIAGIVVALSPSDTLWPTLRFDFPARLMTTAGGSERCHSVLNGLERLAELAAPDDWVLVHDAARPCLRAADIDHLLAVLADGEGGLLGLPLIDTVKRTDEAGHILQTVPREGLWRALTPQMFRFGALRAALRDAVTKGVAVTDEAAAMELAGCRPRIVEGCGDNIKITRPDDLILAELYLQKQEEEACA